MNVVIAVRSCPDYKNLSGDAFANQLNEPYKPKTELQIFIANNIMELWDKSFKMNFLNYRHSLASISMNNYKATGCKILKGYLEFLDWYESDEDGIVVPIDDDDYLSPDLANLVNEFDDDSNVVVWPHYVLHSVTRLHFGNTTGSRLHSNNWAVRKSYLKTLDDKQARQLVLLSHAHADTHFKNNNIKRQVIDNVYSVYNRHAASLSFIRTKIDQEDFHAELPKAAKRPVSIDSVPEAINWIKTYLDDIAKLNTAIRTPVLKFI